MSTASGLALHPGPGGGIYDVDDNSTAKLVSRATTFWYANMDHTGNARGYAPDLDPDFSYPVYKTVTAGDGNSIQAAINVGTATGSSRNNLWLNSQPRVVYLPPGVYTISSTLKMRTDTILMGDATSVSKRLWLEKRDIC